MVGISLTATIPTNDKTAAQKIVDHVTGSVGKYPLNDPLSPNK